MSNPLEAINSQTSVLPKDLADAVAQALAEWDAQGNTARLWARDASLWTGQDEGSWLGWLDAVETSRAAAAEAEALSQDLRTAGFTHALLLGMGGSSLCPEVLAQTFGSAPGFPELHVLDSTDPAQVKAFEARIDPARTVFVVASKSGSTLEPNVFKQYFFDRVRQAVGEREAGSRFVAITDPGSKMEQVAEEDRFRRVFFGVPSIGGRFSALSAFGVVPAALLGVDATDFLNRAGLMVLACKPDNRAAQNPGVLLGVLLGVLAARGRNKLTVTASPGIHDLGAWLEQLVAESTGKDGKAVIPVDRERLGSPGVYGSDRLFVYLRLETAPDPAQDAAVQALQEAGQPVVRIAVRDVRNLGQEFFRWEVATAVAGSLLGINPFNQPDVEASKVETRKLTAEYEQSGRLPSEAPLLQEGGLRLFTDERNARELAAGAGKDQTASGYVRAHLGRLRKGDYFALLAYVEMNAAHESLLQSLRHTVRDRKQVATCLGFGPRFLHSTGQAYKGGPDTGVFLQVTCDDAADLPVPGQKYTFGVVKASQARGDFQVLADRGRRLLRVHLGPDVAAGLESLRKAVEKAVA